MNIFTKSLIAVTAALLSLVCVSSVSAQSVAGIKIQPTLIEQRVNPGDNSTGVFRITNLGQKTDTFYVNVQDVAGIQANGTPAFASSTAGSDLDLSSWIHVSQQSVTLNPGETKEVPFSITVPADATPGAHVGGIIVATQPPNATSNSTVISYGATAIVSLQVGGNVVDAIQIREFRTDKTVYNKPEVTFIARIENTGNTLSKPRGPIEIVDMWGKKMPGVLLNDSGASILPHATREFTVTWKGEGFAFGRYEVLLSLSYGGDSKETITQSTSFWVLPANLILGILGALLVIVIIGMVIVRTQVSRRLGDMQRAAIKRGEVIAPRAGKKGSFVILYRLAIALLIGAAVLLFLVYFT